VFDLDLNKAPLQSDVLWSTERVAPGPATWARSRSPAAPDDAVAQFRAAMQAAGIDPPDEISGDGVKHRCDTLASNGKNDAVYVLHIDEGLPAGWFQNFQTGECQKWRYNGKPIRGIDKARLSRVTDSLRAKRKAETERVQAEVAAECARRWAEAQECALNAYLTLKHLIKAHGARCDGSLLLVPMYGCDDGKLWSIQTIFPEGQKDYPKGCRTANCCFPIGDPVDNGIIYIVEGYATGCSIRDATGQTVFVAFTAGNLAAVARMARARFPNSRIVIVADDDAETARKTGTNTGIKKAHEAAAVGAIVVVPQFGPDRSDKDSDFNDVHVRYGLDEVRCQIEAALGATDVKVASIVESEILPTQPEVSAAIETLTKKSSPDEIKEVIEKIAVARLGPLWDGPMLSRIKDLTAGQTMLALRAVLEAAERQFAPPRPQSVAVAIQFSNRAWVNSPDLATDKNGDPRETMANVALGIREDEEWKNSIWFDEFGRRIRVRMRLPWEDGPGTPCDRDWTKEDLLATVEWIQRAGVQARKNVVLDAVERVAFDNKFHPLRDYLDSLKWDDQPRLDKWANYYLGVEDTPYARAVGAKWMIGAVARIYRPGCKMDTAIVLEGAQGLGKSSAFRILASEKWFTDQIAALGTKDAAIDTVGKWIVELAELEGVKRADVSQVKAFASRATDHYRPPYETNSIDVPRQFVFGGSVNEDEYLKDPTGGRRFWPLLCTSIDLDALARDRDMLWAEAVARYRARERWHLDDEELISAAEREQASRYQEDAWEPLIADWLNRNSRQNVTVADVLTDALAIADRAKWTKADQMRVGSCMKNLGWERKQFWKSGASEWRYVRPNHPNQHHSDEVG
jgi:putative DNA primase/helicase